MKKVDLTLLKVFLYGIPLVALLAPFSYLYSAQIIRHDVAFRSLNTLAGLVFAVWILLSIYLSIRLMISAPLRDQVLGKITFVRERDEREAMLTGKAARTTFLTSLAILIFLFCLSCFQICVYRVPQEQAVDGKTRIVSLGLGFSLLEHGRQDRPEEAIKRKDLFSYRGLPISSATIILMLIVWQIVSYNYSMRRLMK